MKLDKQQPASEQSGLVVLSPIYSVVNLVWEGLIVEEIDHRLVRAIAHPLRLKILQVLAEKEASTSELAAFLDEPVRRVSYHAKILLEGNLIEETRVQIRAAFVEHVFREAINPPADLTAWRDTPAPLRKKVSTASIEVFTQRALAAFREGSLAALEGSGFRWQHITVDVRGWTELVNLIVEHEEGLYAIARRSRTRLGNQGGTLVVAGVGAFEGGPTGPRGGR